MPVNAPLAAAARIAARAGESDDDANAARITRVGEKAVAAAADSKS